MSPELTTTMVSIASRTSLRTIIWDPRPMLIPETRRYCDDRPEVLYSHAMGTDLELCMASTGTFDLLHASCVSTVSASPETHVGVLQIVAKIGLSSPLPVTSALRPPHHDTA